MARSKPAAASSSATALPMPRRPPVTRATGLWVRVSVMENFLCCRGVSCHPLLGLWVEQDGLGHIDHELSGLTGHRLSLRLEPRRDLVPAELQDSQGVRAGRFGHLDRATDTTQGFSGALSKAVGNRFGPQAEDDVLTGKARVFTGRTVERQANRPAAIIGDAYRRLAIDAFKPRRNQIH